MIVIHLVSKVTQMDYSHAASVLEAGISACETNGIKAAIVVVDLAGNIVAAARLNGATYLSYNMAHLKAKTSAGFAMPTPMWYCSEEGIRFATTAFLSVVSG
jgi:uncharacterized protein GlcG (DUF336 family)